ncbi:MAG: class I SAM-dependent methyltransferase [Candidatus Eisenbacteria bacterium]
MDLKELPTERAACNLCGAVTSKTIGLNSGLHMVRCVSCGLVYVNPRPTLSGLHTYYAQSDLMEQQSWGSYYQHTASQLHGLWSERFRDLQRWRTGPGTRLLDVGSGYGDFLHIAAQAGWATTGFEFSPVVARVAREKYGIDVRVGELETLSLPPQSFDVASLWHVLEHMPDPMAALCRVRGLLKEDGILVVEVPNLNFIVRRSYKFPLNAALHLYHFSGDSLSRVVRKAGFEVLECRQGNTGMLYRSALKRLAKKCIYAAGSAAQSVLKINVSDSIRLYARCRY